MKRSVLFISESFESRIIVRRLYYDSDRHETTDSTDGQNINTGKARRVTLALKDALLRRLNFCSQKDNFIFSMQLTHGVRAHAAVPGLSGSIIMALVCNFCKNGGHQM